MIPSTRALDLLQRVRDTGRALPPEDPARGPTTTGRLLNTFHACRAACLIVSVDGRADLDDDPDRASGWRLTAEGEAALGRELARRDARATPEPVPLRQLTKAQRAALVRLNDWIIGGRTGRQIRNTRAATFAGLRDLGLIFNGPDDVGPLALTDRGLRTVAAILEASCA